MSMFSEIGREQDIKRLVSFLAEDMATEKSPEALTALKRVGRWALTQFEWSTPLWADAYAILFKE